MTTRARRGTFALLAVVCGVFWAVFTGLTPWPSVALLYGLEPLPDDSPERAEEVCVLDDWDISESSGLAVSLRYPGCIWTHNDSGDTSRLFLVDKTGKTRAVITVLQEATDWEDMCCFEFEGRTWLLIGDTGDNSATRGASRPHCSLLLLPEPEIKLQPAGQAPVQLSRPVHYHYQFRYSEGRPDCESLAVDVENRQALLLTKGAPGSAGLFRLPLPFERSRSVGQASLLCEVPIPWATGMDISTSGKRLAIVNPISGVLFERQPDQTWCDAVRQQGSVITLPLRRQGETVCFETEQTLLVGSEGRWQKLWRIHLAEKTQN